MKLGYSNSLIGQNRPRGSAFVGALDGFTEGLTECWSHRRKLVSSYSGVLLQGRRMSDDTPVDVVALADGELNAAGLLSFAGSSSIAVAALRGQVNGYDLLQGTADNQRIIVDAGSLVTVGGKAASWGRKHNYPDDPGDGNGGVLTGDVAAYTGTTMSLFLRIAQGTYGTWFNSIVSSILTLAKNDGTANSAGSFSLSRITSGNISLNSSYTTLLNETIEANCLISIIFDGTNLTLRDGTSTYTVSYNTAFDINKLTMGGLFSSDTGDYAAKAMRVQELAIWTSDQTANEAAIRSAMMA